jgi:UDP-N-acetylmuramate--alanine ligase
VIAGRLAGRRLWFVGIGGAGMSALATVASAAGAEVAGWDRVRTPYLDQLPQAQVEIEPEPMPAPSGWETIVSSAYAGRVDGRRRGDFLAEIVMLGQSIVVAGAHGKTTTSSMIAFCLDRLGNDPTFLIGGDVPQLGGNARAGAGWIVAEGDESDRSLELLRPEVAVLTNVDLDHHAEFASVAEVATLFERWLARAPKQVRGDALEPVRLPLAVPGEHNRRNAAAALAALEQAGFDRSAAEEAIVEFRGAGRRFERRGESAGVAVYDDYGHNAPKVAAAIAAARESTAGRVLVLFQPHLYSRTRHSAHELGRALAAADVVAVTDVYGAREEPVPDVTGKLVVDAVVAARPGAALGWTPRLEDGARFVARRARRGDLVLTVGAGDVERAGALVLAELG